MITQLREAGAVRDTTLEGLGGTVGGVLESAKVRREMTEAATEILDLHRGATGRTVDILVALAAGRRLSG